METRASMLMVTPSMGGVTTPDWDRRNGPAAGALLGLERRPRLWQGAARWAGTAEGLSDRSGLGDDRVGFVERCRRR